MRTSGKIAMILAFAVLLHAEERMRAGLWEISSKWNNDQAPAHNTCFTPQMVERGNLPAAELRDATEKSLGKRAGCALKDFKLSGNTLSMRSVCGAKTLDIKTTYTKDAFETVATSTEAGVIGVSRMKGRYLGACK